MGSEIGWAGCCAGMGWAQRSRKRGNRGEIRVDDLRLPALRTAAPWRLVGKAAIVQVNADDGEEPGEREAEEVTQEMKISNQNLRPL